MMTSVTLAMVVVFSPCTIGKNTTPAPQTIVASWYGEDFRGKEMANGDNFNPSDPTTAAHKEWPFGTKLKVTNPKNGRSLTVIVKDRGPFIKGRGLDLSEAGAQKLGYKKEGITTLILSRLELPQRSRH